MSHSSWTGQAALVEGVDRGRRAGRAGAGVDRRVAGHQGQGDGLGRAAVVGQAARDEDAGRGVAGEVLVVIVSTSESRCRG